MYHALTWEELIPRPSKGVQCPIQRSLGTDVDPCLQNGLALRTRTINSRPEHRAVYLAWRRAVSRDLGRWDRDCRLRRTSVTGDYGPRPI